MVCLAPAVRTAAIWLFKILIDQVVVPHDFRMPPLAAAYVRLAVLQARWPSRLTGDIGAIEELVLSGVSPALTYLGQLLWFTAALFYLDWWLAAASLVLAIAHAMVRDAPVLLLDEPTLRTGRRDHPARAGSVAPVDGGGPRSSVSAPTSYNRVRPLRRPPGRECAPRASACRCGRTARCAWTGSGCRVPDGVGARHR